MNKNFPQQHVHFHNILKPKTSRRKKVARSRGLCEQRLNVTRKLRLYREGKRECSVMTLGGSFTRGEWYQISWWDPLGGQLVVPILPLSQLPATHWVSTWIKRINLPTQLYYCAFSLTTTCCLDICDATLFLKYTYLEQPHADTVGADVISILIYFHFILVLNCPYDRCYLSPGRKCLCWLGFRLLCNVSTNT